MGKVSTKRRQFQIKAKKKRKQKIKSLKEKHAGAKNKSEKDKITEKIKRIAPHYPEKEIEKLSKEK